MKHSFIPVIICILLCLLRPSESFAQPNRLLNTIDSLTKNVLNHTLDSSLTKYSKPEPLIFVDGFLFERKKLNELNDKNIKSVQAVSDTLAFKMFDKKTWGGIILIGTNLPKRKLKKIL
jgi:hypothetical protein